MKRTNLVLKAESLEQARQVLGAKTYSATVNQALEEVVRIRKIQSLPSFFGRALWEGNLEIMREDRPQRSRRSKATRKVRG